MLIQRLHELGFSPFSSLGDALSGTTEAIYNDMVGLYCSFHEIRESNFEAHISLERFCSQPDQMNSAVCAFPFKEIKWAITATLPGVSPDKQKTAYAAAWASWAEVSGVIPIFTTGDAHVLMGARRIDGPSGVLAESQLPCGTRLVKQWYDTGENWVTISLQGVACHEIGHALGLSHTNDGGLMDPIYNPRVLAPKGSQELREIQSRYGKPVDPVPVPVPVPVPSDYVIRVSAGKLSVDGYRLTKLD